MLHENSSINEKLNETLILSSLAILIIVFGFYPEPLIQTYSTSIDNFINTLNVPTELSLTEKIK